MGAGVQSLLTTVAENVHVPTGQQPCTSIGCGALSANVPVMPSSFVVHPAGEVHEYENGPARTLLFRVRYGRDMASRHYEWRGKAGWKQSAEDAAYYAAHPIG